MGSVVPAVLTRAPPERYSRRRRSGPRRASFTVTATTSPSSPRITRGGSWQRERRAERAAAAAIWMWAGEDWRPLGKLPGATLDVVALDFAGPTSGRDCLLAASRDRHVALYAPVNPSSQGLGVWGDAGWTLVARVKASAKALYDAGWAPGDADAFASCGRDRRVRVWNVNRQVAGSIPTSSRRRQLPVRIRRACGSPERAPKGGLLSLTAGTRMGACRCGWGRARRGRSRCAWRRACARCAPSRGGPAVGAGGRRRRGERRRGWAVGCVGDRRGGAGRATAGGIGSTA